MGFDTIKPYLAYENKGAFILCRTSNPGRRTAPSERREDQRNALRARRHREEPVAGTRPRLRAPPTAEDNARHRAQLPSCRGFGAQGGDIPFGRA